MLLSLILFSVYRNVLSSSVETTAKLIPVSNGVNTALVSHSYETDTILRCVRLCLKNESASFHYEAGNKTCYCYTEVDTTVVPGTNTDVLYGHPTSSRIKIDDGKCLTHTIPTYPDCLELYNQCYLEDGAYVIRPVGGVGLKVWCNQRAGGWTVIQRRMDGSESFYRGWEDYANGFGNVFGEYWLGLENIHQLTEESSSLLIRMHTFGNMEPDSAFAMYKTFGLQSGAIHNYSLEIGNFTGDCEDGLTFHNGDPFSTFDEDHDKREHANCAENAQAGWWFKGCYKSNLNGPYRHDGRSDVLERRGITWPPCWTHAHSLKEVVMEIRRN